MLALRIEFLTGRSVSSCFNERDRAEWPPHPARVFSALVDTWAEDEGRCPRERRALEWLESQPPPAIAAGVAHHRGVATHFVPTVPDSVLVDVSARYDAFVAAQEELATVERAVAGGTEKKDALKSSKKTLDAARSKLEKAQTSSAKPSPKDVQRARRAIPGEAGKQPRFFPSVTLDDPTVHYLWDGDPPEEVRIALNELAARLTRVGHSSSLVRGSWSNEALAPTHVPDDAGTLLLRVVAAGQLDALERAYAQHGGWRPRTMPTAYQKYAADHDDSVEVRHGALGDAWIVLERVGGVRLPITRAVSVASAVRGALLKHARNARAAVLSGHREDGGPVDVPHLAIVPIPFVGHERADGSLMGVALVLPRDVTDADRAAVLHAVGAWEAAHRTDEDDAVSVPLQLGEAGVMDVRRVVWGEASRASLRAETWCGPARVWMSVTPIALDRNPGDLNAADPARSAEAHRAAAETVARACEHLGVGLPASVTVMPAGTFVGSAKAREFPPFPSAPGKVRRVKVHARVVFSEPVRGPLVLGAGRYLGLGLCRPVEGP